MIIVASLFGMIAFAPPLARMRSHHWITGAVTVAATALFYVMLFKSLDYAGKKVGPSLEQLENSARSRVPSLLLIDLRFAMALIFAPAHSDFFEIII